MFFLHLLSNTLTHQKKTDNGEYGLKTMRDKNLVEYNQIR